MPSVFIFVLRRGAPCHSEEADEESLCKNEFTFGKGILLRQSLPPSRAK